MLTLNTLKELFLKIQRKYAGFSCTFCRQKFKKLAAKNVKGWKVTELKYHRQRNGEQIEVDFVGLFRLEQ